MIQLTNKTKLVIIIIITIIGLYLGFQYILPLFIPFLVSYFIAWLLLPIVRFLYNKLRFPKLAGGMITLGILGTAVVCGMICLFNILIKQIIVLLKNMPIYLTVLSDHLDNFCTSCENFMGVQHGSVRSLMNDNIDSIINTVKTVMIPRLTLQSFNIAVNIVEVIGVLLIIIVSIILLIKDEADYKKSFRNMVFYPDIHLVTSKLAATGIAYLRAQAIMMVLVAALCTGGLLIIKNKYALLIGIGIGIFDAFPVLGSGLILVPWSIISIINNDLFNAAILMTLYLACQLVRQCLEPKLLGNRIGIRPVYTLMSMYVGVRLFGFAGFFLGPLGLVIINTVVNETKVRIMSK